VIVPRKDDHGGLLAASKTSAAVANKKLRKFMSSSLGQVPGVARRLAQMPKILRSTYVRALTGRSKGDSITAFCNECVGWEERFKRIRECPSIGCPLFKWRPYQGGE